MQDRGILCDLIHSSSLQYGLLCDLWSDQICILAQMILNFFTVFRFRCNILLPAFLPGRKKTGCQVYSWKSGRLANSCKSVLSTCSLSKVTTLYISRVIEKYFKVTIPRSEILERDQKQILILVNLLVFIFYNMFCIEWQLEKHIHRSTHLFSCSFIQCYVERLTINCTKWRSLSQV